MAITLPNGYPGTALLASVAVRKDTVGDRVAMALRKSGMDDAEVADRASVTAAWLSAVKNDRIKNPPLDKLLAIARVCGVSGRYLTEPLEVVPLAEVDEGIAAGLEESDRDLLVRLAERLRAPPAEDPPTAVPVPRRQHRAARS